MCLVVYRIGFSSRNANNKNRRAIEAFFFVYPGDEMRNHQLQANKSKLMSVGCCGSYGTAKAPLPLTLRSALAQLPFLNKRGNSGSNQQ